MKIKKILLIVVLMFMMLLNVKASELGLDNIIIDGIALEEFDPEVLEYDLKVASDKESVQIAYEFDDDLYTVATTGPSNVKLKPGKNVFTITISSKEDPGKKLTYKLTITRADGRSNDNTLAILTVANKNIQIYSDKYKYDIEVDSTLKSAEIKATPNSSKAKFVAGYGQRLGKNAVVLKGESTTVEIKIQAENENIQTYKITIIKTNYQSNDATLKSINIKEKNFNFNPNILKYDIEVPNEIDKISLEALPNNSKAEVAYNKNIELKEGINNIVIKVTAEDGTIKEYTLNITRKAEVALVTNIEIEGIDFEFDSNVYEYEIETTLTTLDFVVDVSSKTATYEILNNYDLKDDSIVQIIVQDGDKELTYNFKIVDPNKVVAPKTDINEAGTNVGGSSFLKKYEMYIGLITFGVGLLSLIMAILKKSKSSQIM